jgi:hypothetical protein
MPRSQRISPSFIVTGQRIERGLEQLEQLYRLARELCPDEFIAEETRELKALYAHVTLGLVDSLREQIARKLELAPAFFSRDRFSIHGCGPVGLHDDFFRFPTVYFVVVVAHADGLGLADAVSRAVAHRPGDIVLLDPRAKHALVPVGMTAEEHPYDRTHGPVHDAARQFMFLDFDVRRPDLRARFRPRDGVRRGE